MIVTLFPGQPSADWFPTYPTVTAVVMTGVAEDARLQQEEDDFISAQPEVHCPDCTAIMSCGTGQYSQHSNMRRCDPTHGCFVILEPRHVRHSCKDCIVFLCTTCGGKLVEKAQRDDVEQISTPSSVLCLSLGLSLTQIGHRHALSLSHRRPPYSWSLTQPFARVVCPRQEARPSPNPYPRPRPRPGSSSLMRIRKAHARAWAHALACALARGR